MLDKDAAFQNNHRKPILRIYYNCDDGVTFSAKRSNIWILRSFALIEAI
jgi:hypothetical protein